MFSDYDLIKVLAVGAYAVVYQVRHKQSQEDFALKVVEKQPMAVRLLMPQLHREVTIVKEHSDTPHIVQLLEATETSSHVFLRFELCKASLEDVCKRKGAMTEEEAFQWLRQACLGVKELHDNGVIHRDLKPSNFLVDSEGSLCICDFGFACRETDNLSGMTGTPCYSSPETTQEGPKHTPKVDIYGLGASMQHFLLGRVPESPKDMPKGLSRATKDLVKEMMSPDPSERPSIDELLEMPQFIEESVFEQWLRQWRTAVGGAFAAGA
jgi:serine/threonine protein kinase